MSTGYTQSYPQVTKGIIKIDKICEPTLNEFTCVCAPVGVPVGALRCPLCPSGSWIIPQIAVAVKWCLSLLTSSGFFWYTG
nr:MAG TPA: hypothetical protein [Caudoviricetes sp.]